MVKEGDLVHLKYLDFNGERDRHIFQTRDQFRHAFNPLELVAPSIRSGECYVFEVFKQPPQAAFFWGLREIYNTTTREVLE